MTLLHCSADRDREDASRRTLFNLSRDESRPEQLRAETAGRTCLWMNRRLERAVGPPRQLKPAEPERQADETMNARSAGVPPAADSSGRQLG